MAELIRRAIAPAAWATRTRALAALAFVGLLLRALVLGVVVSGAIAVAGLIYLSALVARRKDAEPKGVID